MPRCRHDVSRGMRGVDTGSAHRQGTFYTSAGIYALMWTGMHAGAWARLHMLYQYGLYPDANRASSDE